MLGPPGAQAEADRRRSREAHPVASPEAVRPWPRSPAPRRDAGPTCTLATVRIGVGTGHGDRGRKAPGPLLVASPTVTLVASA